MTKAPQPLNEATLDMVIGGGARPSEAFFVKCDSETTTQSIKGGAFELTEFTIKGENSTNS